MIWFLALRSLKLRPIRTVLTALGIAVAVAATVVFLSLGEGLRQLYARELGGIGPDLQVSYGPFDASAFSAVPELPLGYLDELAAEADAFGIASITPILLYLRGGLSPASSFLFQGIPAGVDLGELYYDFRVVEGRAFEPGDAEAGVALVGVQAAARGRLALGSQLRLNPGASFEVVGIVSSAGGFVDNGIIVPLAALQEAIGIDDRVSVFALELDESRRTRETAAALGERFPDLSFQTRGDVLGVIEQGIRIADVVRLGISVIALVVGALAVANTVLMSVFERTREFGVVRALGAKPRFLFGLVLSEAVLLSVVGALAGVALGYLGIGLVNHYALSLIGLEVAALTLRLLLFAVAVALLIGLGAGLLPAARAARIPIASAMARE
jgi:putative ABC transport system permease protein